MKFKTLNYLIETYIDTFKTLYGTDEFYINDPLSNLEKECRGVITENGDLYTAKSVETDREKTDYWKRAPIHADILNFLTKKNEMTNLEADKLYSKFEKFLCVQRHGMTEFFYLGESYSNNELFAIRRSKKIKEIEKKFLKKNSDKKIFINRSIDEVQ